MMNKEYQYKSDNVSSIYSKMASDLYDITNVTLKYVTFSQTLYLFTNQRKTGAFE